MPVTYDKYYQTQDLFGEPYPELVEFLTKYPKRGKVLDLGCGQGRDAIALARLGYSVTGLDNSKVGIEQMQQIAQKEKLDLVGQVADIYAFDQYETFEIILLDSMFHFAKNDKKKEVGLIQKIVSNAKTGCLIVVCIQDTGKKVEILNQTLDGEGGLKKVADEKFKYVYKDDETGHTSAMDYRMIAVEKQGA